MFYDPAQDAVSVVASFSNINIPHIRIASRGAKPDDASLAVFVNILYKSDLIGLLDSILLVNAYLIHK